MLLYALEENGSCLIGDGDTPFNGNDRIVLNMARDFSKVLMVKISRDFEVSSRLINRRSLPKAKGTRLEITWSQSATMGAA